MTVQVAVTARAPAKVNLGLVVGSPREDGFHELATVFHAISLYDDVTATLAEDVTVTVEGLQADQVPGGEDNIAVRAARLLARHTGVDEGVNLRIRKGIPVAGGMAGGSADAAATLVACDALWHLGLTRDELCSLAARLGSDVPFSVIGGTAIGTGRGERLTSALARGTYHWVVALAGFGLSTPGVYAELDRLRVGRVLPEPRVPDGLMKALRLGDCKALGVNLTNDMQAAACTMAPSLRRTLQVGRDAGALGAMVSGSGPTVVLLARDAEHAMDLSVVLTASGAVRDVYRARGPVPGARVVEPSRP